jgi:hypothetical protein
MAKFSQKVQGKEVGQAAVYAEPHTMSGKSGTGEKPRTTGAECMNEMNISVGTISKKTRPDNTSEGIKIRGTGAATKGLRARGPMG